MPRYCMVARVDPHRLEEYRERHAAVWPEMLRALARAGWRGYTLHLGEDGLLVGVVDADDLDAARAAMGATEVNARWQSAMADFFASAPGARPDLAFTVLPTVFDLDAQLAAAGPPEESAP